MNHRILLISLFLLPVVFNSGCLSGMSPEDIAKMSSEVKSFLNDYPSAKVTASLLKSDYIASIIGEIREDCGAQMEVTDYWKVNVYDPSTNITVTVWIEDAGRKAVCVVKKGGPCQENWACSEWSGCVNGTASRTCTDSNECNTTKSKPEKTKLCSAYEGGDRLTFIVPPGCTKCDEFEPFVIETAGILGIPFEKTSFGQEVQNPGFFLVYQNVSTIAGIDSEYTFKKQICQITKNTEICDQANALKPPGEPPVVPVAEIPKAEKTSFKFFVMSYCPYANQVESYLKDVYAELGDKAEWEPHYVIYSNYRNGGPDYCIENGLYCSMHGIQELNEDLRELCIWKYETHDKFFDFLVDVNTACNVQNVDTCWEAVASTYGIGTERIKQCQNEEGTALAKKEYDLCQQYNVLGSPTVFINGFDYKGIRSVEAYKAAICSGFVSPPPEC